MATANGLLSSEGCSERLERDARAAVDLRAGRALSDVEWVRARAKLLEFVTILRRWDRQAKTKKPGVDKVGMMIRRRRP